MTTVYAFGLLILLAFLGSRLILRRRDFLSPLTFIFTSGLIYIILGLYLGSHGLNVLNPQVLRNLSPLISLGLGWIGFLFGFQLEHKSVRKFPGKYIGLSMLQAFSVFTAVGVLLFFVLKIFFTEYSSFLLYGMAAALGFLVSLNSPTVLNAAAFMIPKKGNYYYLARFLASVSGFWGVIGLAVLLSFWHFPFFDSGVFGKGIGFLLASTAFPVFIGYLFHLLTINKTEDQDLSVYLIGLVFFVSGSAFYFNLPPLYVSMVLGITYSNLTRNHEKIFPILLSIEKPLYIVFLILIGALWEFSFDFRIALLVFLLILMRAVSYAFPLPVFGKILRFPFPLPSLFGLCFLSPAGFGVAFTVSLVLAYPLPLTNVLLSVALLVIAVSELLSPWALRISLFKLDSGKGT